MQHCRGLVDGPGVGQTQFGYQPVLEGFCHALHSTLGLWRAGENLPDHQFLQATGELGGFGRRLRLAGVVLEGGMAVAVQRQGNTSALKSMK